MKVLIITSAGGGGHVALAKAQKDGLIRSGYSDKEISVVDIMGVDRSVATRPGESWIPTYGIPYTDYQVFSGPANIAQWDTLQKKGGLAGVRSLEALIKKQYVAEKVQARAIYNNLKKFIRNNPDLEEIIDTQAMSTPEICRVVTAENRRRARYEPSLPQIRVRKMLSEFLTDKTVHFLTPLSHVTPKDAQCLTVEVVNAPLIRDTETVDDFFKRKKLTHIHFEVHPASLRAEFRNPIYADEHSVYLKSTSDAHIHGLLKERDYIQSILQGQGEQSGDYFKLTKGPDDTFSLIVLGSQSSATILRYVDTFIDQAVVNDFKPEQRRMLFVAAGKNDGSSNTMYAMLRAHIEKRMVDLASSGIVWPENAKIVPLAFQDDKGMASLFQNVDELVIRTGGMSSIEANETQSYNPLRKVYVHSEASPELSDVFPRDNFDACYELLLEGTVCWEGGNAEYLMQSIGACLTSPDTIMFDMNGETLKPVYRGSLIQMSFEGDLDQANIEQIRTCLNHGSNPNIKSFGGLAVLAYAKDIEAAKLLVTYGGKLTPKVTQQLETCLSPQEIKTLTAVHKKVQSQIKHMGAPAAVLAQFIVAVRDGNTSEVKGLLNRYPKIASAQIRINEKITSAEQLAQEANRKEVLWFIKRTKGATPLQLALEDKTSEEPHLRRLIYSNFEELNRQYRPHVTALTLCQDPSLRQLMVKLGANPNYLAKTISKPERHTLKNEYINSSVATAHLKRFILATYHKNAENEDGFCSELRAHLKTLPSMGVEHTISNKRLHATFRDLKSAVNDIHRMSIIEQFVNFIRKCFFGTDVLSKHSKAQAKQILFFKPEDSPSSGGETPDLGTELNI